MPTSEQLIDEITKGPFAEQLAPWWADVFTADPKRPELDGRIGVLKSDAGFEIRRMLTDPTLRTKIESHVSRGEFMAMLAPLAFGLLGKPADVQAKWETILNLSTGADESVNLLRPEVQALLDAALGEGLMDQEKRDTMRNAGPVTCSRADELGWEPFTYHQVIEAKAVSNG